MADNENNIEKKEVCDKISALIGLIEIDKLEYADSLNFLQDTGEVYERYKQFYIANIERNLDFMNAIGIILEHIYTEYGCTPSNILRILQKNRPVSLEKEMEVYHSI
ncbi:MAG: hypothetical protein QXH07_01305 [Thermoplasmata archaeon]